LHRQILYTTDEIDQPKLTVAAQKLKQHNPEVEILTFSDRLTEPNAHEIIQGFDMVVDGTDNLITRHVINQTCVSLDKPYVFGAVNLYDGQVSVFHASQGPCLACLFPHRLNQQQEKGGEQLAVLNTLPAVVSSLQTTEVIKGIVGVGKSLIGTLLIYNALNAAMERIALEKNPHCPVCGSL
jgi:sulfur-carrier protein adenylyltransferase/sulfurtransferase